MDFVERRHYIFRDFYQNRYFLKKYEQQIKSLLNLKFTPVEDKSVFLHYRIGDLNGGDRMLPLEHYETALNQIDFDNGYISSDTLDHINCIHLIEKYNLKPVNIDPLSSILFGKNFKNIILSEGTFSWWIGFLSRNSNIYCSNRMPNWHGHIFFDEWIYK